VAIQYQNPGTVDLILDSSIVSTGPPAVLRERVVLTAIQDAVGCANYHIVSEASTNAGSIKSAPGQVYGWHVFNNAEYPVFVKFYNTAMAPAVDSGVVKTVGVQAGTSVEHSQAVGIYFTVGIGIAITLGIDDDDDTPVAAGDCVVDVEFT
jgi:hypothetical protein